MSERCFGVVFRLGGGGYLGNLTAKGAEVAQRMQSEKGSWGEGGLGDAAIGRVVGICMRLEGNGFLLWGGSVKRYEEERLD